MPFNKPIAYDKQIDKQTNKQKPNSALKTGCKAKTQKCHSAHELDGEHDAEIKLPSPSPAPTNLQNV